MPARPRDLRVAHVRRRSHSRPGREMSKMRIARSEPATDGHHQERRRLSARRDLIEVVERHMSAAVSRVHAPQLDWALAARAQQQVAGSRESMNGYQA